MNRRITLNLLAVAVMGALLLGVMVTPVPVMATTNDPMKMYLSLQTYIMKHYNDDFGSTDITLLDTGTAGEIGLDLSFIENLEYPKTDMKLDLSESTVVSDPGYNTESIKNEYFSPTLGSRNWTAGALDDGTGTANATVNTDAVIAAQQTTLTFNTTMDSSPGAAVAALDTTYWKAGFYQDEDGDGTYAETGEDDYTMEIDAYSFIYFSGTFKTSGWNTSCAANSYQELAFQFESSGTSDYTISILFYMKTGNSGWDFTTTNGATLSLYDVNGTTAVDIAMVLPINQIVATEDSEGIDISGLKWIWYNQTFNETAASTMMYAQFHNIAFFDTIPYITDGDDDADFDIYDSTTGIWTNEDDDCDLLYCTITEGTNEAYDAQVVLYSDISLENGDAVDLEYYTLDYEWKVFYVTGAVEVYASDDFDDTAPTVRVSRWGGSLDTATGSYISAEVFMQWDFDINTYFVSTTAVGSGGRLPTWSTDYLNFTVYDDDFSSDLKDAQDDIEIFEFTASGGTVQDVTDEFQALLNSVSDNTEYQYNLGTATQDISRTADSNPKLRMIMYTDNGFTVPTYDGTGTGTVTPTTPTTPATEPPGGTPVTMSPLVQWSIIGFLGIAGVSIVWLVAKKSGLYAAQKQAVGKIFGLNKRSGKRR